MADSHGFIALPPDGSGKKVPQTLMIEFAYDTGTTQIKIGDVLSFSTSTFTAIVIEESDLVSGELHCRIPEPVPKVPLLVGGEDILVNGTKVAQVASNTELTPYYFQQSVIAGGENMINTMNVNRRGAAHVTYEEGTVQFDAFGKLETSSSVTIADYVLSYDELPLRFTDTIVGTTPPTLDYNNNTRGITLTVGTAAGDLYRRQTNRYHIYQPGTSQILKLTAACGDSGKTGVRRRWGYYDANNGLYFQLDGQTLSVALRSKSTGAIVNTGIDQESWNVDRLDGSSSTFNPSGATLDVSKDNMYWIDYQWLGAGRVRFGVIIAGERITAHEFRNANINDVSFMSTGSLPITYEIENTGIAASPSTFKFFCATVKREGEWNPTLQRHSGDYRANVTTAAPTLLAAIQPRQTYKTFDNRSSINFKFFSIYNGGSDPVKVTTWFNGLITGGTWNNHSTDLSIAEVNESGTLSAALPVRSIVLGPGESREVTPVRDAEIQRKADITETNFVTITAELLNAGTGGEVVVVANWDEVYD